MKENGTKSIAVENRKISFSEELARKSIHLAMLVIPFLAIRYGSSVVLKITLPLFLLAFLSDFARYRSRRFGQFIESTFGRLMRSSESGEGLKINGATWMLFSITSLLIVFPLEIAASSIALFIAGDAMAALFGRRFGDGFKLWGHASLVGSIAFIGFGAMALYLIPSSLSLLAKAVGLGVGMLVEMPDGPLNDNIRVPWASAIAMLAIEHGFLLS